MTSVAGHVLLVGAGGLGCPALWGLVHAGVARVTVVDPDVVEVSNLPRQILFTTDDIGESKALVAARTFTEAATDVRGVFARLDDRTAADLTRDVDVMIDATDGARTKDWLNALAVRLRIPLVHAAGLRAEGRTLWVPAGGAPCLACLFGRLTQEAASCADYGVWNGVVGVIGFRAASMAAAHLRGETLASAYAVYDFDAGRSLALGANADAACVVCSGKGPSVEPFPEPIVCAVPLAADGVRSDAPVSRVVDLRTVACPLNLLRARQALDAARPGDIVEFQLGVEGAATVPEGVRTMGHAVVHDEPREDGTRLLHVRAVATTVDTPALSDAHLAQFARQIVLPGVGNAGQRRLLNAHVTVYGLDGPALDAAAQYLSCAGVNTHVLAWTQDDIEAWDADPLSRAELGVPVVDGVGAILGASDDPNARRFAVAPGTEGTRIVPGDLHAFDGEELAAGALLADTAQRALVDDARDVDRSVSLS